VLASNHSGVSVPVLGKRERIPQAAIDEVVRRIAEESRPERIILFGSYAYGQPKPDSDVDLLVVMETSLSEAEQAARICQSIDYHFGLDLIVRSPATLARRLALGDAFLAEVTRKGKVVYESTDRVPKDA